MGTLVSMSITNILTKNSCFFWHKPVFGMRNFFSSFLLKTALSLKKWANLYLYFFFSPKIMVLPAQKINDIFKIGAIFPKNCNYALSLAFSRSRACLYLELNPFLTNPWLLCGVWGVWIPPSSISEPLRGLIFLHDVHLLKI